MAFFQPIINLWIDHVPTLHNNLINSNKNNFFLTRPVGHLIERHYLLCHCLKGHLQTTLFLKETKS